MLHSGLALWVIGGVRSIGLIIRKAWERKQSHSNVIRSFVRQKIAMVLPAEFFYERNPQLSVVLELLNFQRIHYVTKLASDHFSSSHELWFSFCLQVRFSWGHTLPRLLVGSPLFAATNTRALGLRTATSSRFDSTSISTTSATPIPLMHRESRLS